MDDPSRARSPDDPRVALVWPLRLTWLGLLAERLVRAFWPLWSLALAVLAVLILGPLDSLPLEVVWAGLLVVGAVALWAAWFAAGRFRWPDRADAEHRLDGSIPGHPLSALADRQAIGSGDAASEAVWQAHLRRMAARIAGARPVSPDLRLARFDRYGLRYVALTVFAVALIFGSVLRVGEVAAVAGNTGQTVAAGPSWEGWIQPPA